VAFLIIQYNQIEIINDRVVFCWTVKIIILYDFIPYIFEPYRTRTFKNIDKWTSNQVKPGPLNMWYNCTLKVAPSATLLACEFPIQPRCMMCVFQNWIIPKFWLEGFAWVGFYPVSRPLDNDCEMIGAPSVCTTNNSKGDKFQWSTRWSWIGYLVDGMHCNDSNTCWNLWECEFRNLLSTVKKELRI